MARRKKNALSIKRQKQALIYIAEKRSGTKEEFIDQYGEIMYNFFTEKSFIHQLNNSNKWEITKLGLRRKVYLCS